MKSSVRCLSRLAALPNPYAASGARIQVQNGALGASSPLSSPSECRHASSATCRHCASSGLQDRALAPYAPAATAWLFSRGFADAPGGFSAPKGTGVKGGTGTNAKDNDKGDVDSGDLPPSTAGKAQESGMPGGTGKQQPSPNADYRSETSDLRKSFKSVPGEFVENMPRQDVPPVAPEGRGQKGARESGSEPEITSIPTSPDKANAEIDKPEYTNVGTGTTGNDRLHHTSGPQVGFSSSGAPPAQLRKYSTAAGSKAAGKPGTKDKGGNGDGPQQGAQQGGEHPRWRCESGEVEFDPLQAATSAGAVLGSMDAPGKVHLDTPDLAGRGEDAVGAAAAAFKGDVEDNKNGDKGKGQLGGPVPDVDPLPDVPPDEWPESDPEDVLTEEAERYVRGKLAQSKSEGRSAPGRGGAASSGAPQGVRAYHASRSAWAPADKPETHAESATSSFPDVSASEKAGDGHDTNRGKDDARSHAGQEQEGVEGQRADAFASSDAFSDMLDGQTQGQDGDLLSADPNVVPSIPADEWRVSEEQQRQRSETVRKVVNTVKGRAGGVGSRKPRGARAYGSTRAYGSAAMSASRHLDRIVFGAEADKCQDLAGHEFSSASKGSAGALDRDLDAADSRHAEHAEAGNEKPVSKQPAHVHSKTCGHALCEIPGDSKAPSDEWLYAAPVETLLDFPLNPAAADCPLTEQDVTGLAEEVPHLQRPPSLTTEPGLAWLGQRTAAGKAATHSAGASRAGGSGFQASAGRGAGGRVQGQGGAARFPKRRFTSGIGRPQGEEDRDSAAQQKGGGAAGGADDEPTGTGTERAAFTDPPRPAKDGNIPSSPTTKQQQDTGDEGGGEQPPVDNVAPNQADA